MLNLTMKFRFIYFSLLLNSMILSNTAPNPKWQVTSQKIIRLISCIISVGLFAYAWKKLEEYQMKKDAKLRAEVFAKLQAERAEKTSLPSSDPIKIRIIAQRIGELRSEQRKRSEELISEERKKLVHLAVTDVGKKAQVTRELKELQKMAELDKDGIDEDNSISKKLLGGLRASKERKFHPTYLA